MIPKYLRSANNAVDKYLSPKDGIMTTIIFPAYSGLCPTLIAAAIAAPDDMPTKTPSVTAVFLDVLIAISPLI